jgi:hypothetical protein
VSDIVIEWLEDSVDCQTCGSSLAAGARVTIDGVVAVELLPVAHCYNGRTYDSDDVYAAVLRHMGHTVTDERLTEYSDDGDGPQP